MKRRRSHYQRKKEYPVLQGHLVDDSKTEICSTDRYKTSFEIIEVETKKQIQCVHWGFLKTISKGQLVAIEGTKKNDCFICFRLHKIQIPYTFG